MGRSLFNIIRAGLSFVGRFGFFGLGGGGFGGFFLHRCRCFGRHGHAAGFAALFTGSFFRCFLFGGGLLLGERRARDQCDGRKGEEY